MKRTLAATLFFASSVVFAQASGTISNGTNSNAQQSVNVNNQIGLGGGGGTSDINYHGSYTMKSAPTVYAPALTASITETCWGSVSGGVSAIGFGITGAATIKDYDCNRRLNASVAGKMGRMDIAFNIMCQSEDFRDAAALTNQPCPSNVALGKQGTEIVPKDETKTSSNTQPNKDGQLQYKTAVVN